jgi:anti-anti-sigma regulatory factor
MAGLRATEIVLVGMRPEIATTLVRVEAEAVEVWEMIERIEADVKAL